MSTAFTNFLNGSGATTGGPSLKDYTHASNLYVANTYARAPKLGFLYFVSFGINSNAITDTSWDGKGVGVLVRKIDLPKFQVKTEMVNQYNRKTQIQTGVTYQPVNIEFHDDNSDFTQGLWTNYFKYYYTDSTVGDQANRVAFSDTKYSQTNYDYGFDSANTVDNSGKSIGSFLNSIDIYVLHQQRFSQYTLVNPLIQSWSHDGLDQDAGNKILSSKMSVAFETVYYKSGSIGNSPTSPNFMDYWYDKNPSPLGTIASQDVFGHAVPQVPDSSLKQPFPSTVNMNPSVVSSNNIANQGYNITSGALGNITPLNNQPSVAGAGVGVNLFSNNNASISGTTLASPVITQDQ